MSALSSTVAGLVTYLKSMGPEIDTDPQDNVRFIIREPPGGPMPILQRLQKTFPDNRVDCKDYEAHYHPNYGQIFILKKHTLDEYKNVVEKEPADKKNWPTTPVSLVRWLMERGAKFEADNPNGKSDEEKRVHMVIPTTRLEMDKLSTQAQLAVMLKCVFPGSKTLSENYEKTRHNQFIIILKNFYLGKDKNVVDKLQFELEKLQIESEPEQ
ncbi:hypothetical protein B0H66DRAFT_596718 [Apodospora peruviana]|uniref:Uncharacterized protein n=1 Tax=Apodospora peruviana TaxID=516989 RepID=A0AAE0MFH8_9PEZI|nr:hypothetical protein B0H66DRAFT_596718 [Apodospora peruviana]